MSPLRPGEGDKQSYDERLKKLNQKLEELRRKAVSKILEAKTYEEAAGAKESFRLWLSGACQEIKDARKAYKGIPYKYRTEVVEKAVEKPIAKPEAVRKPSLLMPSKRLVYTLTLLGVLSVSLGFNAYQALTEAELRVKLIELESKLLKSGTVIQMLNATVFKLSALAEERAETIAALASKLGEARSRIAVLEGNLADANNTMLRLRSELEKSEARIASLEAALQAAEDELNLTFTQLMEANTTIEMLKNELTDLQALNSILKEKLEGADATISALNSRLAEANDTIYMLEYELSKAYEEMESLRKEMHELNKTLYATFNYQLTAEADMLIAYPGNYTFTTITVNWLGGPWQPVNLTAEYKEPLRAELTPNYGIPAPEQPLVSSLEIYVNPQAEVGTYTVTVTAVAEYGLTKSITIMIEVHLPETQGELG